MTWFYLSFADDESFRGGAVVRATDLISATREAWRLKINPGGQVIGGPIPEGKEPPAEFRERLLSKADCDRAWNDCVRLGDVMDEMDGTKIPIVEQDS